MYIHTRVYIIIIKTKYNWDLLYTSIKNFVICAYARPHRVLYLISRVNYFSLALSRWYLSSLYFIFRIPLAFFKISIYSFFFYRVESQPLASLLMRYNYDFSHAGIWRGYTIFFLETFSLSLPRILSYEHALRCANVHCMWHDACTASEDTRQVRKRRKILNI